MVLVVRVRVRVSAGGGRHCMYRQVVHVPAAVTDGHP